jgi:thiol-disulfide isomerase/thioredoxin
MIRYQRLCLLLMGSVASLSGCDCPSTADVVHRDPIFDAPPVPPEVVDRVLTEAIAVPQRAPEASANETTLGDLGVRLGSALEQAATQSETPRPAVSDVRVILFTADWCTYCRPAKEQALPWLQSLGYVVEISDVTRGRDRRQTFATPRSLPAWVFIKDGREVFRQEGGYTPQHLQAAVRRVPLSKAPTVGAFFGPTIRVADALPLVAGMTLKLGSAATISVPADLKWTVSQKAGSVVLSFDPSPQVTVHKVLNWRVRLEGIEITPTAVTLQIDNLPDVTVRFDWSCPERTQGPAIDEGDDMHRAAASPARRRDRPVVRFIGRTVLFAYRVCSIASFVLMVV